MTTETQALRRPTLSAYSRRARIARQAGAHARGSFAANLQIWEAGEVAAASDFESGATTPCPYAFGDARREEWTNGYLGINA